MNASTILRFRVVPMGDMTVWQDTVTLAACRQMLLDHGCDQAFLKFLKPNNNSKNQIYVGPDFSEVPSIPAGTFTEHVGTSKKFGGIKVPIYRAPVDWTWVTPEGRSPASRAQLIYYPQYPEVRLSGLLLCSSHAPSEFMNIKKRGKEPGRILIFGVQGKKLFGVMVSGQSPAAAELRKQNRDATELLIPYELKKTRPLPQGRDLLLAELRRIHESGWVNSSQLQKDGSMNACEGPRCGGHTLEAQLGILANGRAEPDFAGWEIKQHSVVEWGRSPKSPVTLMTPEPNMGEYKTQGMIWFVRRYGHLAKNPNPKKVGGMHFSGQHKVSGSPAKSTGLRMEIIGYEPGMKVPELNAKIALVNSAGEIAAGWSFSGLIEHWQRKHAQAAYLSSKKRVDAQFGDQFAYDSKVKLGTGTDFFKFLDALARQDVFLDPGGSAWPTTDGSWEKHARSQFRIRHRRLGSLYEKYEEVDLLSV